MEGIDKIFVEIIDVLNPYDILSKRFQVYPMHVTYNNKAFKITLHNQVELINSSLDTLNIDSIQLFVYNNDIGINETIKSIEIYEAFEGSNYLGDAVYNEILLMSAYKHAKNASFTAYLTIFDKDGHYYNFEVKPKYVSEINMKD